jgi:hypothetical protein
MNFSISVSHNGKENENLTLSKIYYSSLNVIMMIELNIRDERGM